MQAELLNYLSIYSQVHVHEATLKSMIENVSMYICITNMHVIGGWCSGC